MAKKLSKENKLVIKNYEDIPNERERLKKDVYHLLEYNTTMRFLKKYLPKKGHILDAG